MSNMNKLKKQLKNDLNKLTSPTELNEIKKELTFRKKRWPLILGLSSSIVLIAAIIIILLNINLGAKVTFLGFSVVNHNNLKYQKNTALVVDSKDYYAKPGDTLELEISFSNPEYYDIISFVISGTPYTSYMFNDGSNYETIYVNYQLPLTSGTFYLNITEIKYIDNTTIKNVKMKGNSQIEVGIAYTDYDLKLTNLQNEPTSLGFNLKTTLTYDLTSKLKIALYDASNLINELPFTADNILFTDLIPGTTYTIKITGEIDLLDGKGLRFVTLLEEEISTSLPLDLSSIIIGNNYADFSNLAATVYYQNQVVTLLNNLEPDSNYQVELHYQYLNTNYIYVYQFRTSSQLLPTIYFDDLIYVNDSYILTFTADTNYEYYVNATKCTLSNGIYSIILTSDQDIKVAVYLNGNYLGDVNYEKNNPSS